MTIKRYLFPCCCLGKPQQCQLWSSRRVFQRVGASGPDFWFWDLHWRHRCQTVDTTSQCRLLSAVNNVAGPCGWSFFSPKVSFKCASVHLRQHFLHLAAGDDYLDRHLLSVSRLPVMFQHAVFHCKGFPLDPITFIDVSPVTDIPSLRALSSLHLLQ